MGDVAIQIEGLAKLYHIGTSRTYKTVRESLMSMVQGRKSDATTDLWALKDVSFTVNRGEVVGIIGRNGAGKSTLLKVLSRITEPTAGKITLHGRVGSLLEVGTGFHPELTGRENIYLNGSILGMRRSEIARNFDAIVDFSEVERFLDTPVKHYSTGMYMRLAFAVAAHLEPEILIVDEVLAVGDAAFQKKCLGKMSDVASHGRTVLFVSHNMQAVKQLCQRTVVLEAGKVGYDGPASEGIGRYFGVGERGGMQVDVSRAQRRLVGSGARLQSVTFRRAGEETTVDLLTRNDDLDTQVSFRLERPVEKLQIAMAVVHAEGVPVFSEVLSDQGALGPATVGEHEVTFTFRLAHLKPEAYHLAIFLFDGEQLLDGVEAIPLPPIQDPTADPFVEARRWGLTRVPVRWSPVRQLQEKA